MTSLCGCAFRGASFREGRQPKIGRGKLSRHAGRIGRFCIIRIGGVRGPSFFAAHEIPAEAKDDVAQIDPGDSGMDGIGCGTKVEDDDEDHDDDGDDTDCGDEMGVLA